MIPAAALSPLLTTVLCDGATGQDGAALSSRDGSVNYAQFRRDVLDIRDWLCRLGCTRGDRVAICLPKSVAAVELIFGILAADAAYVPLNHRSSMEQLRRILEDLQPFMIIGDRGTARALLADPLGVPTGMRVACIGGGSSPLGLELVGVRPGTAREPPADSE